MKGFDLVVLYEVLSSTETSPTYLKMATTLGLSTSQVFEAVERCVELRFLAKDRRTLDTRRLLNFAAHALPYIFPSKVGAPGKGMALSLQPAEVRPPGQSMNPFGRLVWLSEDDKDSEGLAVEPLAKQVPMLAARDPKAHRFFSYLEILRLVDHPFKSWASEQLAQEIESLSAKPASQTDPGVCLDPKQLRTLLDVTARHIAHHGFRQTKLEEIARLSEIPLPVIQSHFPTESSLFNEVTMDYMKAAGQYIGRLMIFSDHPRKEDFREVLFDFLSYLERNEDYFRVMLWCYLETEFDFVQKISGPFTEFITHLGNLMSKIPGNVVRTPSFRGYVFSSVPQWYAFFLWAESRRFKDVSMSQAVRTDLKKFIVEDVLDRVLDK